MVKFGHELAQGINEISGAIPELQEGLHYKDLKKLIKFSQNSRDRRLSNGIAAAARAQLTSSFWAWPEDAHGLEGEMTVTDWARALLERKLRHEVTMIRGHIDTVQGLIGTTYEAVAVLQRKVRGDAAEGGNTIETDIRRIMELHAHAAELERQLERYAALNYTGFFKILKKFDKAHGGCGLPPSMQKCMPFVDESIALVRRDGAKPSVSVATGGLEAHLAKLDQVLNAITGTLGEQTAPENQRRATIFAQMQTTQIGELIAMNDATLKGSTDEVCSQGSSSASAETNLPWNKLRSILSTVRTRLTPPIVQDMTRPGYDSRSFGADVISSIVISVAGIPKAMAYAHLAGVPVEAGIATLYVPCLVYGLLGPSRHVAISPQSVTCLLLAGIIDEALLGTELEEDMGERLALTLVYTFSTGLVMMCFGLLRLGFLLNFISRTVLSGFVSASAMIAAVATLKGLIGISVKKSPILYTLVRNVITALPTWHMKTTAISVAGIMMMFTLPPLQKRIDSKLEQMHRSTPRRWVRILRLPVRVPAVLYVVAVGLLIGGTLCGFTPFMPHVLRHIIYGRGATFPAPFLEAAGKAFACAHYQKEKVTFKYLPTGSGDGLTSVMTAGSSGINRTSVLADFAASDILPPRTELSAQGVAAFPVVRSFICAVAHLPLISSPERIVLILDMPTIGDIFTGAIRSWTDKRIRDLNPNLNWGSLDLAQELPISVAVRQDPSGTTQAFSEALVRTGNLSVPLTPGLMVDWGAPFSRQRAASGNEEVMKLVASTPWSIGYVSLTEAMGPTSGRAACAAIRTDQGIVTAQLAWGSPEQFPWPLMHTSNMLVPRLAASVEAPIATPRFDDTCEAREWLYEFLEHVYSLREQARGLFFDLSERPPDLDVIRCSPQSAGRAVVRDHQGVCKDPGVAKPKCDTVRMTGYIHRTFLEFHIPAPETQLSAGTLVTNSLLLACVTLLEHVANVKLYADRGDYKVSVPADLVAVGLSNVVGGAFGSFLVAGGFSRSALNAKAASQGSGFLSAFISCALVYAFAPLLSMLPDAVLNVVLFAAVIHLIDVKTVLDLARLRRKGLLDISILTLAFVATCFLGVVQGMILAVAGSFVVFLFNSTYPQIVELRRIPGSMQYEPNRHRPAGMGPCGVPTVMCGRIPVKERGAAVKVIRFEAPLYFANAPRLIDRIAVELKEDRLQGLVLDLSSVPWVDVTAATLLKQALQRAKNMEVTIALANANPEAQDMIQSVCKFHGTADRWFFETIMEAELAIQSKVGTPDQCNVDIAPEFSDSEDDEVDHVLDVDADPYSDMALGSPSPQQGVPPHHSASHVSPAPKAIGRSIRQRTRTDSQSYTL